MTDLQDCNGINNLSFSGHSKSLQKMFMFSRNEKRALALFSVVLVGFVKSSV